MATITDTVQQGDLIAQAITEAVHKRVEQEIERLAAEAADRLRATLREQVATIALTLLSHFDIERHGRTVVIRVRDDRSER